MKDTRISIKVEVVCGVKHAVRNVYTDSLESLYIKLDGKKYPIYKEADGKYTSVWFNRIEVINE